MSTDIGSAPGANFSNETDIWKFPQDYVEAAQETKLCFPAEYCAYSHLWLVLSYLQFETEEIEIHKTYNGLEILLSMK